MAKRKPRKRYSRSMVVDHFEAIHGNTKPCAEGECPIVTAMGGRISVADACTLDSKLAQNFDRFTRKATGSSLNWHELTAADIVRVTRETMAEAA